ncbi:MAG TPA: TMEM165/GDT1 family protein [Symbiobacteriaceae bacterium]
MEWKSALATFILVFFAELGDKTQLMVMSLAARSRSPHLVFLGAAAALVASSLLAALAGDTLLRAIPLRMVKLLTGVAFLVIGALLIVRSLR